jgi:hypothetical protein
MSVKYGWLPADTVIPGHESFLDNRKPILDLTKPEGEEEEEHHALQVSNSHRAIRPPSFQNEDDQEMKRPAKKRRKESRSAPRKSSPIQVPFSRAPPVVLKGIQMNIKNLPPHIKPILASKGNCRYK